MRLALVLAISLALLAPAAALAGPRSRNSKCEWIARQLVHADAMKVRAAEIDDELGVDRQFRSASPISRTTSRSAAPSRRRSSRARRQFAALLKTAASAALSYLTLGAY